jgi:hypothetical protein
MLPDDVLVEIFYFSQCIVNPVWFGDNTWHALVHVCRRWRYLVFASPRHLNLRLEYRGHRPMSEVLDAWPDLTISVSNRDRRWWDNTVAALESAHYNRISEICIIEIPNSDWERFTEAMQKPFPELTHLQVSTTDVVRVLPDSFMGGSAQRLRSLSLGRIPFPSLPKLLLSAHGLVKLNLWYIPHSGYFSPDAMASALTAMTRLELLRLQFYSPPSRRNPGRRSLPPPTRSVLPALTQLEFKGVYEDLEVLLARIDAPRLHHLDIEFFKDLDFDVPQLHRFINHVEEFKAFDRADVMICDQLIVLCLPNTVLVEVNDRARLELRIIGRELVYQLSALCQVCSSSIRLISALEELEIRGDYNPRLPPRDGDMENARWLEFLDPFTSLKSVYLFGQIVRGVCGALQELSGERAAEVLPALRNLFVPGRVVPGREFSSLEPVQGAMKLFLAARQLSGHPVVVYDWEGSN